MKELYFDHAASTPMLPEVIQTMSEVMTLVYANPSSLHKAGATAAQLVQRAQATVATAFTQFASAPSDAGSAPKSVPSSALAPESFIFTSGGTESNNLAIHGVTAGAPQVARHVITSAIEHSSVSAPMRQLEEAGFEVTYLPVDPRGVVDPAAVEAAMKPETVLVSIMYVNNEVGSIQPLAEIGKIVHRYPRAKFHVDATQGVGKLPALDITRWYIDLLTSSAHKIGGPRGVGLLYVRPGLELTPLLYGGGQQQGLRPGTENVPAIVAASKAYRRALASGAPRYARNHAFRDHFMQSLQDLAPYLVFNSTPDGAPHIMNFSLPGLKPEVFIHAMEEQGMMLGTKSACSSKDS